MDNGTTEFKSAPENQSQSANNIAIKSIKTKNGNTLGNWPRGVEAIEDHPCHRHAKQRGHCQEYLPMFGP